MESVEPATDDAGDPADPAGRLGPGLVHLLLDELAQGFAARHRDEAARAKDEYFDRAGKVFEDDGELFEARMASFLEWCVLERRLADGRPPVLHALAVERDDARQLALSSLACSHRSLFDVAHVEGSALELEDVIGGGRFRVLERRSTVGFEIGDIVEARLVWAGQGVVFGKTFLFHPRDAREQVLAHVDASIERKAPPDDVMFLLSRLHLRWRRLGHVPAAKIYRAEQP